VLDKAFTYSCDRAGFVMFDNQCLPHGPELYGVLCCPVPACGL